VTYPDVETVAVLITDLVDSTAIADRIGPVAAEELRVAYFALLRSALERAGGREVKTVGDGLMVVFSNASSALICAVEMQQALEAHNRRGEERLDLRIGVSFGEATFADGDYFGEAVVEAARLCAHARGGQIVVSALVRQVAGARVSNGFQPLGELVLKGISVPVAALELEWDPILDAAIALPERLREVPSAGFVGRIAERARLAELWREACAGSRRLALIGGEAGVGKTALSTHLAQQAHAEGAAVLYGRCDEDIGVPYQPWAQGLSHFVSEAPSMILDQYVEAHGGDLARLIPEIAERVPGLHAPRHSDPETERYLLYAAISRLLEEAARQEPILLILDDLHWADGPTLSLLRHVIGAEGQMGVMLLATYRDSDLSRDHPLVALLADLHREHGVERVSLSGLHSEDVLAMMEAIAGHELGPDVRALAPAISRETAGNPFFAGELLRHLTESGAIVSDEVGRWRFTGAIADLGLPQTVREVIGRRVARLGEDARAVLSVAAVIGRDFEFDLLLPVLELTETRLLDVLEEAVAASLLKEHSEHAGWFTFTHALVEHALYEDLGPTRRASLHRRLGEALEQQCGDEPGERLAELASHWAAATVSTHTAKALHYARLAADRALGQLAPDEAARWYRKALELHAQLHGERSERCELLIGLGEAERQVGDPAFRHTLLDAAELAQALGDSDRLCRAVLANNRGWASSYGGVDVERVDAIEAAATALGADDPRRAQVLALLATELQFADEPARCHQVAAEAITLARTAGDRVALAHTIANAGWAVVVPQTLAERRLMMDELGQLAPSIDDPRLSARAAVSRMMVGLELGDRAQAADCLTTIRVVAASVPEPFIGYVRLLLEFGWALLEGDLRAAEQWAVQAYEVGIGAEQPDAAAFLGAHIFHIRYFQGRCSELTEDVMHLAGEHGNLSGWRAGAAALALIEGGREEEARELVHGEDIQGTPQNEAWAIVMMLWADACSQLRLVDRAGELYELLAPFSGQLAVSGAHVYGSFDWALGALASTAPRRLADAERHFAAAAAAEEELGAPLLLARTRARWARALIASGAPEDLERAQPMLEQAQVTASRLGAPGLTREVVEGRAALAASDG